MGNKRGAEGSLADAGKPDLLALTGDFAADVRVLGSYPVALL